MTTHRLDLVSFDGNWLESLNSHTSPSEVRTKVRPRKVQQSTTTFGCWWRISLALWYTDSCDGVRYSRMHTPWPLSPEREPAAVFPPPPEAPTRWHSHACKEWGMDQCQNSRQKRDAIPIAQIPLGSSCLDVSSPCILAVEFVKQHGSTHSTRWARHDEHNSQLSLLCNLFKVMICKLFTDLLK